MNTGKRRIITATIIGMLLAALPAEAGYGHKGWSRYADIASGNKQSGGFRRLVLPPPVLGRSASDLSDLRLAMRSGREVPYALLYSRQNEKQPGFMAARLLSLASRPGDGTVFTVDTGRDKLTHDSVTLDTSSNSFSRPVTVEGSDDNLTWKLLQKESYIFSLPDQGGLAWKTMEYPATNCRYLRVKIENGTDKPLGIDGISVNRAVYEGITLSGIPVKHFKTVDVPQQRLTKVKLDLGYANIPLARLSMYITDPAFVREVMVLGSRDTKHWRRFSGALIFRNSLGGGIHQKTRLQMPAGTSYRHLMLVIRNGQAKPLHIKTVTAYGPQVSLVFRAEAGKQYRLFFGRPGIKAPVYDIQQFHDSFSASRLRAASLGPIKIRGSAAFPLQRSRTDMLPASGGILLIAIALLLFTLRRQTKERKK